MKRSSGTPHVYALNGTQILTETIGNKLLVYLYDESGAPIGMQYRTTGNGVGEYATYFFEKNLQGDIVAVYTSDGRKIGSYIYDAWGACTALTETGTNTQEKQIVRTLNPFRYRGYYYDTETGLYYLQTRYYSPQWGRFLNADAYVNANGDLIGFNMFAYCGNNPVLGFDPTGEWDWGDIADAFVSIVATTTGIGLSVIKVLPVVCSPNIGIYSIYSKMKIIRKEIKNGIRKTGTINNIVNAIYYHFSDGESDLEQGDASSYVEEGYINRWKRLDYVKSQLHGEYTPNAWRYYSEYNFHMYAWLITKKAYGQTNNPFSEIAESAYRADVVSNAWDGRPGVDITTFLIGLLGY